MLLMLGSKTVGVDHVMLFLGLVAFTVLAVVGIANCLTRKPYFPRKYAILGILLAWMAVDRGLFYTRHAADFGMELLDLSAPRFWQDFWDGLPGGLAFIVVGLLAIDWFIQFACGSKRPADPVAVDEGAFPVAKP